MKDSSKKPWVYWDTSLLLAFLSGADANKVKTVSALIEEVMQANAPYGVVFSQFIRAELRTYSTDIVKHRKIVDEVLLALRPQATRVRWYPVTRAIGDCAMEIGSLFPTLKPPDAVHIATALNAGADRVWTYDGIRKPGARRSGGLTEFDGHIEGLRITEPNSLSLMKLWDDPLPSDVPVINLATLRR